MHNQKIKETASTIDIEGYHLHYRIAGSGPPLLLIHGYGVSSYMWQRVLPYLAERHQVLNVDLPGYGRSRYMGTWQLRAMAPLLAQLLQRLDLSRVALLGHSMGGAIAIHLADYAPEMVGRMVLVNAAGLPLQARLPTLALRSLRSLLQLESGGYPAGLVRDVLHPRMRLLWQGAQEMVRSDFRDELARLKAPTLIIWGARDLLLPPQLGVDLNKSIPHSRFVLLERSGHRPMLAQPQEFSRLVLQFLQEEDRGQQDQTIYGSSRM